MNIAKKQLVSYLLNALIFILGFTAVLRSLIYHNTGSNLGYYTELSNLFGGIVALMYVLTAFIDNSIYKRVVTFFKAVTVTMLSITFLVSAVYLAPTFGSYILFGERLVLVHFIIPLIALISFLLFDTYEFKFYDTFSGACATSVYGLAWIIKMLATSSDVDAPYPFLQIFRQPGWQSALWFIGLVGLAYLVSFLLYLGNKKLSKLINF
ncbi:MAG: hypothetical protein J6I69_00780 [Bacilli bacterium]|nr:hypothetical protein [Bacilli bacterium]